MIRNYILIALRNIRRNLSYTIINIAGLSLGITCTLVLFLLVTFFSSFDNFHPNADRIYRLVHSSRIQDRLDFGAGVPNTLPEALRNDINGIEKILQISGDEEVLVTIEQDGRKKIFKEENKFAFTDSVYFSFFDQKILSGKGCLSKPNEAVISTRLSEKYFGKENPVGKTIRVNNVFDVTITGLMEAPRDNSSFPFEILMSFETVRKNKLSEGWGSISSDDQCYVMLEKEVHPQRIEEQLQPFVKKYHGENDSRYLTYFLQPLREIHYDTRMSNFSQRSMAKESIWAMAVIAIFLIVTACINFVNLTTAVAVRRSREVGIRKVLGSQRLQLVIQYLSETGLITLFAMLLSLALAELALINLNSFLELNLHIDLTSEGLIVFGFLTWITVSVVAGLYPAFLLSGFNPALALKNSISNRSSGGYTLRRGLVVFQFMISQFLIIGTIILLAQMQYFNTKDLGFTKEAIIAIPIPEKDNSKKRNVQSELLGLPGVESTSLCLSPPSSGNISMTDFKVDGIEGNQIAQIKTVDRGYVNLFELELVAGHNLNESDTAQGWLVNERLVKAVGLEDPTEILGRNLKLWDHNLPVVGVLKDFHTFSLEREIDPTIMFSDIDSYQELTVKLKPGEFNSIISQIEQAWSRQYPDFLFSYEFLDESIASFYEDTQKMSVLLILFSVIAIIIGCLGLYGLIAFMANQKQKEIGVRKVLGATTAQIMAIFSKEFTVLVFIAFLLASPLAGFIMNKWLENFAYRISLGWPMFIAGITTTLVIAFVTVGYRSLRAARTNPADVLRSE